MKDSKKKQETSKAQSEEEKIQQKLKDQIAGLKKISESQQKNK